MDWISAMPSQLDFLRDLVAKMKEHGCEWAALDPSIRGNPVKCTEAIAQLETQIREGERILQEVLVTLSKEKAE